MKFTKSLCWTSEDQKLRTGLCHAASGLRCLTSIFLDTANDCGYFPVGKCWWYFYRGRWLGFSPEGTWLVIYCVSTMKSQKHMAFMLHCWINFHNKVHRCCFSFILYYKINKILYKLGKRSRGKLWVFIERGFEGDYPKTRSSRIKDASFVKGTVRPKKKSSFEEKDASFFQGWLYYKNGRFYVLEIFSNRPPLTPTPKKPPNGCLPSTLNSSLIFEPRDMGFVLFCS